MSAIKTLLKKNPYIYRLNAFVKAILTKRASEGLGRRYARLAKERGVSYRPGQIPQLISERIHMRGLSVAPKQRLRIFWVGASLDQDNSGILQALGRFGEVIEFKNYHGVYGLELSANPYDPHVIERNSRCLVDQVRAALEAGPVDVLVGQMWANFLSVDALKRIQDLGVITVNISWDDRLPSLWGRKAGVMLGSIGLVDGLDLVLVSSPECCVRYLLHGCPVLYWPMASDPDLFQPAAVKDIDVSFIGSKYGIRGELVAKLQASGIDVLTYGPGWANGPVDPVQAAQIFGRSKVILGVGTIAYNKDIYTMKLRDFDATMAGALYITHRNPDLLEIFTEGKEIECYQTVDEAVRKIVYYSNHIEERDAIARAAAAEARRHHTWEQRMAHLFSTLGLRQRGHGELSTAGH